MPAKGWKRNELGVYVPPAPQPPEQVATEERKERRYKRPEFLHGKPLPTRAGRRW